ITGVLFSVFVVVLGNWLLRGLFTQIQSPSEPDQPVLRWPWRWTICLYLGMWLLFLVAFGATGVYRHTAWLMAYREPWVQSNSQIQDELTTADSKIRALASQVGDDINALRQAVQTLKYPTSRGVMFTDQYEVIFYCEEGNHVAAYLIIPRRTQ